MNEETPEDKLAKIGWIQTFSGSMIQPMNLKVEDLYIEDIAHALSRVCRFAGHCFGQMNVAAHSIRVLVRFSADNPNATNQELLTALLHDASEAFLGDLPRPLKRHPNFAFYRELEARAESVIAQRFDTLYPMPQNVADADNAELRSELDFLRYDRFMEDPEISKREFLSWFHKLGGR